MLLKSLVIIGALLGLVLGTIGTSIPLLLPGIFTSDPKVIQEVSCTFFLENLSFHITTSIFLRFFLNFPFIT